MEAPTKRFTIQSDGTIKSVHSGLVLDVKGGAAHKHEIIQYKGHGGANQKFSFHPDGTIRVAGTKLCLDIHGSPKCQGCFLQAYEHNGGVHQRWRLVSTIEK
eukprot:TRINITY_DN23593_c0_g1_i1.p1 TRINITY_DN23593_c0_g1~~TRINITY_DN23593_c0_g1_i1.p1  ORF type:complete len:102 (-),score=9.32 TRINITY_DN23593_c0_g1_i1:114-419(-)